MCIDLEGDSDGSDTEPVTTPVSLCSEMLTLCVHTYVCMYVGTHVQHIYAYEGICSIKHTTQKQCWYTSPDSWRRFTSL